MNKVDSMLNKILYAVAFLSFAIAAIILLTSCAVTQSESTTTLTPMRSTNVTVVITDPATTTSIDSLSTANINNIYIKTVEFFYGGTPPVSDQAIMEFGEQWCDLLIDGMQPNDVIDRIHEGAIDNDDARMHFSIVNAAIMELCPSQKHKSEQIAIRSFLPEE
jgi:hypothetical protein